jgi:hypothetical protein
LFSFLFGALSTLVLLLSSYPFSLHGGCGGILSLINPSVPHPDPLTISAHLDLYISSLSEQQYSFALPPGTKLAIF